MEQLPNNRAIIEETLDALTIRIPAQKQWLVIGLIGLWFVMSINAMRMILPNHVGMDIKSFIFEDWFMLLWIAGMVFALVNVFVYLGWFFAGQEIITVTNDGQLTIDKKPNPFIRKKVYDLRQAEFIRIRPQDLSDKKQNVKLFTAFYSNIGIIHFDYGLKTIRFGAEIDEAEARQLLETLVRKGYIKQEQIKD
jgi:hypothetical protein